MNNTNFPLHLGFTKEPLPIGLRAAIADLIEEGKPASEIADLVDVSADEVRAVAKEFDLSIAAPAPGVKINQLPYPLIAGGVLMSVYLTMKWFKE